MMKLKKLYLLVSIFALVAVLCTGCVKYNMGIVVNDDNSADLNMEFLINSSIAKMGPTGGFGNGLSLAEAKKSAEKEGFKVSSKTEGDMEGFEFTKHFNNLSDLSKSVNNMSQVKSMFKNGKTNNEIFSVKKGFLQDTYTLNLDMNLTSTDNNPTSGIDNPLLKSYGDQLATLMEFKFKVTVPYSVGSQNATTISNGGKTLEWNLKYGTDNKISAVFYMYTSMALIFLIIGIVIVLIILLILFMVLRRKMMRSRALRNQYPDIEGAEDQEINPDAARVAEDTQGTETEVKPETEELIKPDVSAETEAEIKAEQIAADDSEKKPQ
jgi:hypothetical protein